jgi:NAD(P)-dependent dehydrogenase (short-subunit alcohol dehydrogenase family)
MRLRVSVVILFFRDKYMSKVAVVTGAGSGVGRAAAVRLFKEGWRVVLVGRREQPLKETVALAKGTDRSLTISCDLADPAAVMKMAADVLAHFGQVDALVHAAGTNIPKRSWDVLTIDDYRAVIDTNLNGAFYCMRAFLPAMRKKGGGTIVMIVSDAGIIANAKAGAAYVASKFGERGLVQSINAEERQHGIRATALCPGDINTPILDKRAAPPPADARTKMLQPEDIAECIMLAINLPERAVVEELVVRPR